SVDSDSVIHSVILIQLVKLRPQRRIDFFDLREIKLSHLGLIRNRQRLIQRPRRSSLLARRPVDRVRRETRIQVADSNVAAAKLLQILRDPIRRERFFDRGLQVAELALFLDLDDTLLEHRQSPATVYPKCNAQTLERETGIEPATNSLEGCDSTTELLPPENQPSAISRQLSAKPPLQRNLLEPMIRIELMTSPLPRECSTN